MGGILCGCWGQPSPVALLLSAAAVVGACSEGPRNNPSRQGVPHKEKSGPVLLGGKSGGLCGRYLKHPFTLLYDQVWWKDLDFFFNFDF